MSITIQGAIDLFKVLMAKREFGIDDHPSSLIGLLMSADANRIIIFSMSVQRIGSVEHGIHVCYRVFVQSVITTISVISDVMCPSQCMRFLYFFTYVLTMQKTIIHQHVWVLPPTICRCVINTKTSAL